MALEHALLVALSERPGSGLELAGRFEKSIGFFWHATHQQIYRVLGRMETDGWLSVETVAQSGRPDRKVYSVSGTGAQVLAYLVTEGGPNNFPALPVRDEHVFVWVARVPDEAARCPSEVHVFGWSGPPTVCAMA